MVGIIAAAPDQRQDAFKGKVGFTLQKLQTVYRIDRTAGTYRPLTGQTGFRGESFAELAVHMEHIAGTHDIAFADLTEEEWRIGQAGLVAVRLFTPLRPGSY